ncbi:thioredoxin [bacterium]|nr:thioredoxin [bacterium]
MATSNLTMANLQSTLETKDMVLIDFWASWCGPCKSFGPVFEKVSEKHADIAFMKVDTEAEQELSGMFGIQAIPTLAIFREGILLYREAGAASEAALENLIDQVKKLDMDQVRADIAKQEQEHEHGCDGGHGCSGCGHNH